MSTFFDPDDPSTILGSSPLPLPRANQVLMILVYTWRSWDGSQPPFRRILTGYTHREKASLCLVNTFLSLLKDYGDLHIPTTCWFATPEDVMRYLQSPSIPAPHVPWTEQFQWKTEAASVVSVEPPTLSVTELERLRNDRTKKRERQTGTTAGLLKKQATRQTSLTDVWKISS